MYNRLVYLYTRVYGIALLGSWIQVKKISEFSRTMTSSLKLPLGYHYKHLYYQAKENNICTTVLHNYLHTQPNLSTVFVSREPSGVEPL
jgi:hypothetical protein